MDQLRRDVAAEKEAREREWREQEAERKKVQE